ncbi:hypothetical protein ASG01_13930 [Chryseobacterium sp. Leaf180]|uniref:DUF4197 family protein n=1 Tax=Chryseobacterium sp. Leaf180 TaxID=1736289 RepID=UPI0007004100|nr:DUF4197 family protein [Chryseobacterium sp. Leaf180]KQR91467.1 hypothetical protein ASG01_13930 [Chryseobacterium sp. Leaf180]
MKKLFITAALLIGSGAVITTSVQSCATLATTDLGMAIVKKMLLRGIDRATATYSSKDAFMRNDLIEKALPKNLREIYNTLQRVAPSLVARQKENIAEVAVSTVNISKPILQNAVNNLTKEDVRRIVQGGKGVATTILIEKSSQQLVQALAPRVEQELNKYGVTKTLNTALSGSNILGGLLGGTRNEVNSGGLSMLVSEQLVNGMYNIIRQTEEESGDEIKRAVGN